MLNALGKGSYHVLVGRGGHAGCMLLTFQSDSINFHVKRPTHGHIFGRLNSLPRPNASIRESKMFLNLLKFIFWLSG